MMREHSPRLRELVEQGLMTFEPCPLCFVEFRARTKSDSYFSFLVLRPAAFTELSHSLDAHSALNVARKAKNLPRAYDAPGSYDR
jgi:hypothetical protein